MADTVKIPDSSGELQNVVHADYIGAARSCLVARWPTAISIPANSQITVTNLVAARVNTTPAQWNATTGRYTAPVDGIYMVTAGVSAYGNLISGSYLNIQVRKNFVGYTSFLHQADAAGPNVHCTPSGAIPILLAAGDVIDFTLDSNVALTTQVASTYFSVTKL
jgi:hypothetical protein